MKFRIGGDYDIDVDGFWSSVFFNPEFMAVLYREGLNFQTYEILSDETDPDGGRRRRLKAVPNFDMPAPIRRKLGAGFSYIEEGHFDPTQRVWNTNISIPTIGDTLNIHSSMWFTNRGHGRSVRTVEFETTVRIFGFGRLVERFLEKTLRDSYEEARVVTNRWIRLNVPTAQRQGGGVLP